LRQLVKGTFGGRIMFCDGAGKGHSIEREMRRGEGSFNIYYIESVLFSMHKKS
jgi:hypothetical protein